MSIAEWPVFNTEYNMVPSRLIQMLAIINKLVFLVILRCFVEILHRNGWRRSIWVEIGFVICLVGVVDVVIGSIMVKLAHIFGRWNMKEFGVIELRET